VAEAVVVAGEPMEGGDVTVTTIMGSWSDEDPTCITAGMVVDIMMMGNDTQR
jgi:hypothetical protein